MKKFILLLIIPFLSLSQETGCVSGDCENGQGTYVFVSGTKYEGEFKARQPHGQGTITFPDGNTFVGELKDGKQNGQGTFTWFNGDKYEGEFKDGKQNGQGTYTQANGDKYVGEYKNGNKDGQGTFTRADGDTYVGEFKDGKQNGQGTFTRADGDTYVGEFKDGKQNGQGTYIHANGDKYVGEYKDGMRVGVGTYYFIDGKICVFTYNDSGERINTKCNNENFYEKSDIIGMKKKEKIYLKKSDSGCQYLSLKINGKDIDFLFDTGASNVTMNITQWKSLGLSEDQYEDLNLDGQVDIVGSNDLTASYYKLKQLSLDKITIKNVVIGVVSDENIDNPSSDNLLGIGFLDKFKNAEWNYKDSQLTLYN